MHRFDLPMLKCDPPIVAAVEWLLNCLAHGPQPALAVQSAARDAGLRLRTLQRAKRLLRVRSLKLALRGPWYWAHPDHPSLRDAQALDDYRYLRNQLRVWQSTYTKAANPTRSQTPETPTPPGIAQERRLGVTHGAP